tara:strand:+ start:180 stop:299 length:120 start_codon:yes stop_codon:yes gene_type:complete
MIAFFTVIFLMILVALLPLHYSVIKYLDTKCPYKIEPRM